MLATCSSPLADFVTASGAVFPSEPGAPLAHSGISFGVWAFAARVNTEIKVEMTRTDAEVFIGANHSLGVQRLDAFPENLDADTDDEEREHLRERLHRRRWNLRVDVLKVGVAKIDRDAHRQRPRDAAKALGQTHAGASLNVSAERHHHSQTAGAKGNGKRVRVEGLVDDRCPIGGPVG